MFGKSKQDRVSSELSQRVRQIVERDTAPPPQTNAWTRKVERAVRQAIFRQGALILADGEKLPVALKNISASGARIEYFVRRDLPERVILVEATLRIKAHARVVWQRMASPVSPLLRDAHLSNPRDVQPLKVKVYRINHCRQALRRLFHPPSLCFLNMRENGSAGGLLEDKTALRRSRAHDVECRDASFSVGFVGHTRRSRRGRSRHHCRRRRSPLRAHPAMRGRASCSLH